MPREKEGFRDQYRMLAERFPDKEAISVTEACSLLGVDRRVIVETKDFPKIRLGAKYIIPLVALARWMS